MKISVIIPALNEEEVIEKTLRYLMNAPEIEVIVSDGGSMDQTVEIASRHARIVASKSGRGNQMDAGAAEASGDILLFLHADTVLPENWKDEILLAMSDKRVVGGAFSLCIDSDRYSHKIIAAAANIRSRLTSMPYGDQGIFARRSVFESIGGFRDIPIMEDVDLMQRLKRAGKVVLLKDKVMTSARRWEKEGVVYTTLRNWLLITLYYMGVYPERLYRFYKVVR